MLLIQNMFIGYILAVNSDNVFTTTPSSKENCATELSPLRCSFNVCCHRFDDLMQALTSSALVPLGTTGRVWRKSSANNTTISLHCFNTYAKLLCIEILHIGVSNCCISRGILNVEWAVFPPINNVAAIPDDATANAISA
ncbi:hypothetical protein FF38_11113 [Lucilia cuprina]|uniref:Uncharacterized protein n=1 Tax=Lucilia cuprina TaxID=7375 RepID=A0A0L0CRD2_LUCCU|nr:hypothetical protein FF38_11113 [Lucilia cuprina]